MTLLSEKRKGADYKQVNEPVEHVSGMLWYNSDSKLFSMADGEQYSFNTGTAAFRLGGYNTQTADKLTFTTENVSTLTYSLGEAITWHCCVSKNTRGYKLGGYNGATLQTKINYLDFITDVNGLLTSGHSQVCAYPAGIHSYTNGYKCSGGNTSGTAFYTKIDKLVFSNENCVSLATGVTTARYSFCGINSKNNGYLFGGYVSAGTTSLIDRFVFSTDTPTQLTTGTQQTTLRLSANGSSSKIAGYSAGGRVYPGGTLTTLVGKILFADETTSNAVSGLPSANEYLSQAYSSDNGYLMGGNTAPTTRITRLMFDTEITAALVSGLSVGTYSFGGMQDTQL